MNPFELLAQPFPADKIHWRVGATTADKSKGIALAYIDARDVMERLDEVLGPQGWQCDYPFPGCCRIGIAVPRREGDAAVDVEWIWKSNGAGATDIEGEKGQYSDAFKRAAVLWGIGRYLYDLPNTWVPLEAKGRSHIIKQPPVLPKWALPGDAPLPPKSIPGADILGKHTDVPSADDEEDMYLRELVHQQNHKYDEVIKRMNDSGKTKAEIINIYEGLQS